MLTLVRIQEAQEDPEEDEGEGIDGKRGARKPRDKCFSEREIINRVTRC